MKNTQKKQMTQHRVKWNNFAFLKYLWVVKNYEGKYWYINIISNR